MLKKNEILIKLGQIWTIGKGTQKLVKEVNNLTYDIGNEVYIKDFAGHESLIGVQDTITGLEFDVTSKCLGKLISE